MGTHTPINIPNKQGQLTLLGNLCYLLVSVISKLFAKCRRKCFYDQIKQNLNQLNQSIDRIKVNPN